MSATPRPTPTTYGDRDVYTVAGFNLGIHGYIKRLPAVWIEGEIAELKRNPNWGFVYLVLKDPEDGAMLSASMARRRFDALAVKPAVGERVHVLGRAEFMQKKGELRLTVIDLQQVGLGMLLRQIEELRQKLAAEGLFAAERKRPLPRIPGMIGLICGSDAAAKRDVVNTAMVRHPPASFRITETVVQGAGAAVRIATALAEFDADPQIDVIVLARGGGSVEDLLPFSSEQVCRAVAACRTPVVSAIGHEQDHSLVDLVADVRAGTPSLAGSLIVPDHAAETAGLHALLARATRALEGGCERNRKLLELLSLRPAFADPQSWITTRRQMLDQHAELIRRGAADRIARETTGLSHARDRLRLLGPAATLERGYAVVQDQSGAVVSDSSQVSLDTPLAVRLSRGRLTATVTEVDP